MNQTIGQILTRLRMECGMSQRELAARLHAEGVQVSNQAVSKWENDATQPNARQFLALLTIFGVRDALTVFTGAAAAAPWDSLNHVGQEKVRAYISDLQATGRYDRAPAAAETPRLTMLRTLPLYQMAVSAGTGQFLEESDFEEVTVGDEVPANADFGVRLAGDSMQPRFADGQIVWVHRQNTLEHGQIGIFGYDGSAYCKRLELHRQAPRLCSLNPAYAPILLRPGEELIVFGRVVG